jgi:antitoxin CcdA
MVVRITYAYNVNRSWLVRRSVRRAVNLSLDVELLEAARAAELNLSATLEQALRDRLRKLRAERWLVENRRAIEVYNEQIAEQGVFSDGLRSF